MKKINNRVKIFLLGIILIVGFGVSGTADAADPSVYISPSSLHKKVGDTFDISVKIDPEGQEVCVAKGRLNLDKLSCQEVKIGDGISVQTLPSCDEFRFLLGLQGCTTKEKTLFTVTVRAEEIGTGTAELNGVEMIGQGALISSVSSSNGSYDIASLCDCGAWSIWQNEGCGAGECSSYQHLQVRTRICTPAAKCKIGVEARCIEDSNCRIQEAPETPISFDITPPIITLNGDSNIELTVGDSYDELGATAEDDVDGDLTASIIIDNPVDTNKVGTYTITYTVSDSAGNKAEASRVVIVNEIPSAKDGIIIEETTLQKGLLANLSVAVKEISRSVFATILIILCLGSLILIGFREWALVRRKEKK